MNVYAMGTRFQHTFPSRALGAAAAILIAVVGAWEGRGWTRMAAPRSELRAARKLADECRGWVVFQRERTNLAESIFVAPVGSRWARRLAAGRYPRWSPDGRWIAFFQSSNVCVMTAEGRKFRVLTSARVSEPHALAFHPSGEEIWFSDGNELRAVDWTGRSRTVLTNLAVRGLGFSADGRRVMLALAGHRIVAAEVQPKGTFRLGPVLHRGCSAAISPDGVGYTHLGGRHDVLRVRHWNTHQVQVEFRPPEGYPVDNEVWSNHPRWLVCRSEWPAPADVWILDMATTGMVRVVWTADAKRADLWVARSSREASGWWHWWLHRFGLE
jgi:hypothetical protein